MLNPQQVEITSQQKGNRPHGKILGFLVNINHYTMQFTAKVYSQDAGISAFHDSRNPKGYLISSRHEVYANMHIQASKGKKLLGRKEKEIFQGFVK